MQTVGSVTSPLSLASHMAVVGTEGDVPALSTAPDLSCVAVKFSPVQLTEFLSPASPRSVRWSQNQFPSFLYALPYLGGWTPANHVQLLPVRLDHTEPEKQRAAWPLVAASSTPNFPDSLNPCRGLVIPLAFPMDLQAKSLLRDLFPTSSS